MELPASAPCDHVLVMKKGKCLFDATTMAYLGHIISAQGIAMDVEKVDIVRAWSPSCTV
jgi:hypothetical protein